MRLWLLLILLLPAGPMIRAAETLVEVAPDLRGAWVTPATGWDGRTVLLFHGMASDMNDVGDLLKRLADGLAAKGIASLRINFRGEGDARRTKIESTFTTRVEDAASAHAWILQQRGVNPARVGVQGFSLGASTAIETGARHPDWFKTMAVWSSPSGDAYAAWQNNGTAQQAIREGEATEDIPGWKKLTTKREFYESFRGINLDRSLAKYPGAFLTVRGTEDVLPHRDDELVKIARGRPVEAVLLGGADHIFRVFDGEAGSAGRVLEVTVSWFERTL